MALAADTKRVVDQFEFTDADVNNHVQEFLSQMSMFPQLETLSSSRDNCQWLELIAFP